MNDATRKRLWLLYRITPEEQLAIEEWQRDNGFGLLLGTSEKATGTDHEHATGLIRGRLDFRLNKALGYIESFVQKTDACGVEYVCRKLGEYHSVLPAVKAVGVKYGLLGKARRKKKMVYGPPE